ncbi:MAG: sugar kinase [Armatimonadetes bacterium CG_4_10_14_0_8_um_filter_66_14]|nr:MAG: sugar kinase [Armatimonadetes bacterium CG_4_10_14_0_8_um_filter_66_14]
MPTELLPVPDHLLALEIGGTKLQLVQGDRDARILGRRRITVDPALGAPPIREAIQRRLRELTANGNTAAIGVGFGGPVDMTTGKIAVSHQVEGWADFPLRGWLEELTGLPAQVENDSNAATLAEAVKGAGAGYGKVFYTNFGSGMGGGMAIDGQLYHGATPGEAEIGLMQFDREGTNFESRCCGWAVDAKVRAYIAERPDSLLARVAGDGHTRELLEVREYAARGGHQGQAGRDGGEARYLLPAIHAGDSAARAILEETAEDIAFALSHVMHLFHPEVVVLGGGLSLIGEPLREAVARFVPGFLTKSFRPGPDIRLSSLGEDVVCVGALLLARERRSA